MTALELAKELVKFDDDHDCRLCSKYQWSETPGQYHDRNCPMAMAYAILEAAQAEGQPEK